jgi:hypothetical protein
VGKGQGKAWQATALATGLKVDAKDAKDAKDAHLSPTPFTRKNF